jgi:hypothetical protein
MSQSGCSGPKEAGRHELRECLVDAAQFVAENVIG